MRVQAVPEKFKPGSRPADESLLLMDCLVQSCMDMMYLFDCRSELSPCSCKYDNVIHVSAVQDTFAHLIERSIQREEIQCSEQR